MLQQDFTGSEPFTRLLTRKDHEFRFELFAKIINSARLDRLNCYIKKLKPEFQSGVGKTEPATSPSPQFEWRTSLRNRGSSRANILLSCPRLGMSAHLLVMLSLRPTGLVPVLFRGSWGGDIGDILTSLSEDDVHRTALLREAESSLSLNLTKGVLVGYKKILLTIFVAVESISSNDGL